MPRSHHNEPEVFTVFYTNKLRFLLTTNLPVILIFWAVLAFMTHEGTLDNWYAQHPDYYPRDVLIAKVFFAVTLVDAVLTLGRMLFAQRALIMSETSVSGMHAYIWRTFAWDEIETVRRSLNNLIIVRKPKTLWEKVSRKGTWPGSRYRREVMIIVPLKCVDETEKTIQDAMIRFGFGRTQLSATPEGVHQWA